MGGGDSVSAGAFPTLAGATRDANGNIVSGGTTLSPGSLGTPVLPANPEPIGMPTISTPTSPTVVAAPLLSGTVFSTPTVVVPGAPSMPEFVFPEMEMPKLPELSSLAKTPSMGTWEIEQARFNQQRSIAGRTGRKNTFLTTPETRPSPAMPTPLAARREDYARTAG